MRAPRWLCDLLIRRRYRKMLQRLFDGDYTISIAHTIDEYEDAFRLVRIGYVYQGYLPMRSPELRIYDQHLLPESVVLVAKQRGNVVGTMTLTLDSPAGLPLDKDYPEELAALRRSGEKLVEYGALAVLRPHQGSGVPTLMNMAATWISSHLLRAERVVIGINPRVVDWYRQTMSFTTFGARRDHADLDAPVVGMTHHIPSVPAFQRRHFPCLLPSGLRADEHFFRTLPAQVQVPPVLTLEALNRWKLPREVFRALFVERTDRLAELDVAARKHLEQCRSPRTLEVATAATRSEAKTQPDVFLPLRLESTGPLQVINPTRELSHVRGC